MLRIPSVFTIGDSRLPQRIRVPTFSVVAWSLGWRIHSHEFALCSQHTLRYLPRPVDHESRIRMGDRQNAESLEGTHRTVTTSFSRHARPTGKASVGTRPGMDSAKPSTELDDSAGMFITDASAYSIVSNRNQILFLSARAISLIADGASTAATLGAHAEDCIPDLRSPR